MAIRGECAAGAADARVGGRRTAGTRAADDWWPRAQAMGVD